MNLKERTDNIRMRDKVRGRKMENEWIGRDNVKLGKIQKEKERQIDRDAVKGDNQERQKTDIISKRIKV